MKRTQLTLNINDKIYELEIAPHLTLLEVLRDELNLTGSKDGCNEGACGSCTVHMDGMPIRSCLTLAVEAKNRKIKTVEGLADGDKISLLQQSFIDHGAVQCGFCTPGMLMASDDLLAKEINPDEIKIRKAISGHVCRCTGYAKIVEAVANTSKG
jgi:aerobic carbon-monoxide dehydrogenase small subunit